MKRRHIYNIIDNPDRKSDCSFGCDDSFTQDIRVGWGSEDSHSIAHVQVNRRWINDEQHYEFYLNGTLMEAGVHKDRCFTKYVLNGQQLYVPEWAEETI